MAGLDPAIHGVPQHPRVEGRNRVDARDKPGHDGSCRGGNTMTTVLITGANRGIGLELARQYAAERVRVIATCRHEDLAGALHDIEGVERHVLDVADGESIKALARKLRGTAIDVLINNAGLFGGRQEMGEVDARDWLDVMTVDALGPYRVSIAFLEHLLAGRRRMIATLTSRMGSIAENTSGGYYVYRPAKAALNIMMKSLSVDLAGDGVTVLLLHPGWVQTDMGGPGALITAAESVRGLRRMIDTAGLGHSGRFFSQDGSELPW